VGYGKGGLFNNVISKARARIVGHYGLTGTNDQVKSMVEWLLAKCQFLYGDLDLKVSELFH
jgi:hypothetical protein